ncbi:MAG: hypothetical protein WDN49_17590 [Acetobacteraceae bacterium]
MKRLVLLALLASGAPVMAAPHGPLVLVGTYNGFGRVVFMFAQPVAFQVEQTDQAATLHFSGVGQVPGSNRIAHNVVSVQGGPSQATVTIAPGSRVRTVRVGNRIIVDVFDARRPVGAVSPAPAPNVLHPAAPAALTKPPAVIAVAPAKPLAAASTPAAPTPAASAPAASASAVSTPVTATPAAPVPAQAMEPAPVVPVTEVPMGAASAQAAGSPAPQAAAPAAPPDPLGLAATHVDLPPGVSGTAALLPFARTVGAAAFRRGGFAWVVFDERRPIDLAALKDDPVLAGATVQMLTAATLLRLKLAEGAELRMTRQPTGWTVAALPSAAPLTPIIPVNEPTQMRLTAQGGGQVVVVPDPETGQNLLVGTLRDKPAGVAVARQVPDFVLQPTWQGVLVEPLSDRTDLRATQDGFVVDTGGAALSPQPDAARALSDAAFLTRRFDFPSGPPAALLRRLQAQVDSASRAPAQARATPRKEAAQTMIALGMGAEAQALLHLAAAEDPRLANDPDAIGLSAIAALLAGRESEAAGLADPALTGTDEVALWRAVRAAMKTEGAPEASPVFATTLPLILAYPPALRSRLLPLAAETMALGHVPAATDALLAKLPQEPLLAFARALRLQAKGDTAAALAAYDALATSRDRLVSTRAATRAILLRQSTGALTPAQTASALEGQFFAWRGDRRELDLRLRVADLRAQAGAWRPAFDLLRQTASLYPDDAAMIHGRTVALMTTLLTSPAAAKVAALDLVTLAEENADEMAVAPDQAAQLLADKLVALDLPQRAGPVLERMMHAAPIGTVQARLGLRLGTLRFGEGDDKGALAALSNSQAETLPQDLVNERGLLGARITAHQGHPAEAAAALAALGTAAADDLRASVLTDAHEWRGAEAAMLDLVAKTVPPTGPLSPEQQDTLLRLASASAMAGDDAELHALGSSEAARVVGPRADMFRLLTEAPVSGVGDIQRSASEVALARAIPAGLAVIGSQ